MDKKTRPILDQTYTRLKEKGWKKIAHGHGKEKKTGVAILISNKMDFKVYSKRQRRTLHDDKGNNPTTQQSNNVF